MLSSQTTRRKNRSAGGLPSLILVLLICALSGCTSTSTNTIAVNRYYNYDFTGAREALRGAARTQNDKNVLLNNLRLGTAALADGDSTEAEAALSTTFDLLSTAGLNEDRTTAAVLLNEGVRIWKGEPFEQALAYYYVAAHYATLGDWENVRAAATNSLFRLTDFGADQHMEELARQAARNDDYLEVGYTAVDTNFALGFLMQAIGSDLTNSSSADAQFNAAAEINPDLTPIIQRLRSRDYNTLLLIDYGKGPAKIAYGPDDALVRFAPTPHPAGPAFVHADGIALGQFAPAADVDQMAHDHRWRNLEDIRRAKSTIGHALVGTGLIAASIGSHRGDGDEAIVLAGLGMLAAGLLTKSGATADTRYFEFAPKTVYVIPLQLRDRENITIRIGDHVGSTYVMPNVRPGTPAAPRAVYLRLHDPASPSPPWLRETTLYYTNDYTTITPGDGPWILGGYDVSTPTREVLETYQAGGWLTDFTLADLVKLYRSENILIGSGRANRPNQLRNPSFRHILEGGSNLFTPLRYSLGYKQLMYAPEQPYTLKPENKSLESPHAVHSHH